MNVSIVTNGTLMSERHQRLLMHPAVFQINFSLQSFEANFPDMDNEKYLNTIFKFTKKTFTKRPDIHINFRLWNSENFELSLIRNRSVVDRIQEYFKIPDDVITNLSHLGNRLTGDLYLNFSDRFEWPEMNMPFHSKNGRCPSLKNQFGILADGTLVPCCLDRDGVIALGNCNESSVQEILDSERATTMLNGFRKNTLVEPLCQRCKFNQRFSSSKN
jgi:radical SAM protein with 4Fe4S-binding SPASM domain